jgi:hypothetical protein
MMSELRMVFSAVASATDRHELFCRSTTTISAGRHAHVLDVGAIASSLAQRVVCAAEDERGEQVFAVAVVREGAGLAHERPDHVPVLDAGHVLAAQSRDGLDDLVAVPNLEGASAKSRTSTWCPIKRAGTEYVRLSTWIVDQRRTSTKDARVLGQTARWQWSQSRALLGDLRGATGVQVALDDAGDELDVRRDRREVTTAAYAQRGSSACLSRSWPFSTTPFSCASPGWMRDASTPK